MEPPIRRILGPLAPPVPRNFARQTEKLGITSGPLASLGNIDLNYVGYLIVALFVLTWVIALSVWRFGRIEEKWSAGLRGNTAAPTTD